MNSNTTAPIVTYSSGKNANVDGSHSAFTNAPLWISDVSRSGATIAFQPYGLTSNAIALAAARITAFRLRDPLCRMVMSASSGARSADGWPLIQTIVNTAYAI